MAEFTIMDVGHGSCCYLIADNRNVMVFDCGHNNMSGYGVYDNLRRIGHTSIELLIITNYDEDHISGIENLRKTMHIKHLYRNKSISPDQLQKLKMYQSGEISSAMHSMLEMMSSYNAPASSPDFPGVSRYHFYNPYPFQNSESTNNISVVTILQVKNTTFLIPGDIEAEGWIELLANTPTLRDRLKDVDVYIASHHGRKNGYCEDIFRIYGCNPDIFIFSDENIKYGTQESHHLYNQWAKGITYKGRERRILTTRNDGPLTWNI